MRCRNDDCEKREKREEGASRLGRMIADGQQTGGALFLGQVVLLLFVVLGSQSEKRSTVFYYYEIYVVERKKHGKEKRENEEKGRKRERQLAGANRKNRGLCDRTCR